MSLRYLIYLIATFSFNTAAEDVLHSSLVTESATLASLFSAQQAEGFSGTLAIDENVQWRIYTPRKQVDTAGIIVFVSPSPSGDPQQTWIDILDRKNLIWVSAIDYGNSQPTAQRILTAIMGLTYVRQHYRSDSKRIYIAGMSGGGRVASKTITMFPRLFTGALYIVGVDFWSKSEQSKLEHVKNNRYVFLTGHKDFNRRQTERIYKKYKKAGVEQALLMDLPGFGHEYPDATQFEQAIKFLDMGNKSSEK
jgi:predicted esterase